MAKNKNKTPVDSTGVKKYAEKYVVLDGAEPVQLKGTRQAKSGQVFRAKDILCFPQQLDTLLKLDGKDARIAEVQ